MAEQLGVSKTPVREALTRLEQEGLVETDVVQGRGGHRLLAVTTCSEIYELRELLEGAAVRVAAESASPQGRPTWRISDESQSSGRRAISTALAALLAQFDIVLFEQVA